MIVSEQLMRFTLQWTAPLILLGAYSPLRSQTPAWFAGVAKLSTRPDLDQRPGTGFVVALKGSVAYIVTSAHVIAGDDKPRVDFYAETERSYQAAVEDVQALDVRGLALLKVSNPPRAVRIIPPGQAALGNRVQVAGYPAPSSRFSLLDLTISRFEGDDVVLSQETQVGYSGGPVVNGNAVVGIIYGRLGQDMGKALRLSRIKGFLEGHGLSWSGTGSEERKDTPAAMDISGVWRDTIWGNVSQITQRGDKYTYTASGMGCRGYFQSSGSGTINENKVESTYQSTYSQGRCSGTVSSDGKLMTSKCSDSVCGEFASTAAKQ